MFLITSSFLFVRALVVIVGLVLVFYYVVFWGETELLVVGILYVCLCVLVFYLPNPHISMLARISFDRSLMLCGIDDCVGMEIK